MVLEEKQRRMRVRWGITEPSYYRPPSLVAQAAPIQPSADFQQAPPKRVRNLETPVPCKNTPVQELFVPYIAGVYMLFENRLAYIGQSRSVISRLACHVENAHHQNRVGMKNPRCCLLMEIDPGLRETWRENTDVLFTAEDRFIVAALKMGITLTNSLSGQAIAKRKILNIDLETETFRLRQALQLFDYNVLAQQKSPLEI